MPPTVLIASPEHLPALQEDLGEVVAFSDADALRALDTITRQRPNVVALERLFAATSRGTALINRIKADPSLTACEIRIVSIESGNARAALRRSAEAAAVAAAGGSAPVLAVAEPPPAAVAPLDQRGTRRAPRVKMAAGLELQIDGNPVTLVDLSIVGAQVVSQTILKPNQRVRVTLPSGSPPLRVSAAVAWASFEIPKGSPRYRAGVEFFHADEAALTRFIDANRK